jgi:hypothetical protein
MTKEQAARRRWRATVQSLPPLKLSAISKLREKIIGKNSIIILTAYNPPGF